MTRDWDHPSPPNLTNKAVTWKWCKYETGPAAQLRTARKVVEEDYAHFATEGALRAFLAEKGVKSI